MIDSLLYVRRRYNAADAGPLTSSAGVRGNAPAKVSMASRTAVKAPTDQAN
ncbi:hypothetical protein L2K20_15910 [Mycobacterium sp. MBM]|nr:hypothetical protein [Mycobacterium sp. MBM]